MILKQGEWQSDWTDCCGAPVRQTYRSYPKSPHSQVIRLALF